jgi:hypothetical protein
MEAGTFRVRTREEKRRILSQVLRYRVVMWRRCGRHADSVSRIILVYFLSLSFIGHVRGGNGSVTLYGVYIVYEECPSGKEQVLLTLHHT